MSCDRLKFWPRRIALFVRDYVDEFPMVWSLVRMRDCERWGGHYWGVPEDMDGLGRVQVCSGCGTTQTVPPINGMTFLPIHPQTTTVNTTSWAWGQPDES